jgi:ubiquinone biosynthesis protein UbiJ
VPERTLGVVERILNAQLAQSTPARRQVAALAGRRLGIALVGPEIELVLTAETGRLRLERESAAATDASVAATPVALFEALRAGKAGLIGRSEIAIAGDAQVLESFSEVLIHLRPDVEELLATYVGDIVAHEAARVAVAARDWARRALDALAMNSGEYLQEESRALPARHEIEAFLRDVDTLRDDVERAAARLNRLRSAQSDRGRASDSATERD